VEVDQNHSFNFGFILIPIHSRGSSHLLEYTSSYTPMNVGINFLCSKSKLDASRWCPNNHDLNAIQSLVPTMVSRIVLIKIICLCVPSYNADKLVNIF
jgi:hypothetical protein